jgi:hypothetical protein
MEIFLSSSEYIKLSLAVDILLHYTRANRNPFIKVITLSVASEQALALTDLPFLVTDLNMRGTKCANPMRIIQAITQTSKHEKIFLGEDETLAL